MTGVTNSIRQQQSRVCSTSCKAHTVVSTLPPWSNHHLHVIRDDCNARLCVFTRSCLKMRVWLGQQKWWAKAPVKHWRDWDHWEKKQWQRAASREHKWGCGEMRQEGACVCVVRGECCLLVWFSIIRPVFSILLVLKFITVYHLYPHHPCILSPPETCTDKPLSWYSSRPLAPHFICATLCRPLSPIGEAVNLFIITRLSEMGEGHGCSALGWNLGRTLEVTHMLSSTADNSCLSPGLISASVGQPQGSEFASLPKFKPQRWRCCFLQFSNLLIAPCWRFGWVFSG